MQWVLIHHGACPASDSLIQTVFQANEQQVGENDSSLHQRPYERCGTWRMMLQVSICHPWGKGMISLCIRIKMHFFETRSNQQRYEAYSICASAVFSRSGKQIADIVSFVEDSSSLGSSTGRVACALLRESH